MSKHPDNIIKISEALLETNKKHCQEINKQKEAKDILKNKFIALKELYDLDKIDQEEFHIYADNLLIEFVGDDEITKIYNSVEKWYC